MVEFDHFRIGEIAIPSNWWAFSGSEEKTEVLIPLQWKAGLSKLLSTSESKNVPNPDRIMIKFAHTNIITDDWKRLADFYIQVFGCKPVGPERDLKGEWLEKGTGVKDAHIRGVHLAMPGYDGNLPTLEIFQYDQNLDNAEPLANRKGFGHIAFVVHDVEAVLERVLHHGESQVGEVASAEIPGAGSLTFVYVRDIDGNIIEIQNWK